MKFFLFFILIVLLVTGCVFGNSIYFKEEDISTEVNLVRNGNFTLKSYNNDLPDGWVSLDENDTDMIFDNSELFDSKFMVKIKTKKTPLFLISESFPIDSKGSYYSRCYIESETKTKDKYKFMFLGFDSKGKHKNKFTCIKNLKKGANKLEVSSGFFSSDVCFGRVMIFFPENSKNYVNLKDVGVFFVGNIKNK